MDISAHIKELKGASLTDEKEQKACEDIAKAKEAIPHINRDIKENVQRYNFLKHTKPKTVTDFILGYIDEKKLALRHATENLLSSDGAVAKDFVIVSIQKKNATTQIHTKESTLNQLLSRVKQVSLTLDTYTGKLRTKNTLVKGFQSSMDKSLAKDLDDADQLIDMCEIKHDRTNSYDKKTITHTAPYR